MAATSSTPGSIQERLNGAKRAKDEGTAALLAGNVRRASFLYKSVYLYVGDLVSKALLDADQSAAGGGGGGGSMEGIAALVKGKPVPLDGALQGEIDAVYCASLNNLALTHLKLGRPVEAIRCATRVLAFEPKNHKALFRRARGRIALGLLAEARADLTTVLEWVPGDSDTVAALAEVDRLEREAHEKEKQRFRGMFDAPPSSSGTEHPSE